MKNRKIKSLTGWLLTLAVMFSMVSPSFAGGLTEQGSNDPLTQQIIDAVNSLQGQVNSLTDKVNTPALPQVYAPNVKLVSPQSITAQPGESLDVVLTVANIGTSAASGVLTQATPETPLSAVFLGNSNIISNIPENKTASMTMTITVDSTAKPGTYAVTLDHSYKTHDDQNKTGSDKLFVHVGGSITAANVTLSGFTSNRSSIMPGESVTISANLENLGDGTASQVQTSLGEIDTTAIYLTSDINTNFRQTMEAGYKGKAEFTFRAADDAKNGSYPLNFKLTYKTEAGEAKEAPFTYFINISSEASENEPNLQIKEQTATSGQIGVGATANISLRLINTGSGEARRVKVTATPADAAAVVPTSGNIQSIQSLAPGAEQVLNFSFMPTPESKTQSYVVGFKVEYFNAEDTGADAVASTFEQYASISVNNPDADKDEETDKISKPKIIVSEYAVNPVIVRAGEEFDLDINFLNTSSVKAVENIKVTIEAIETTEKKGSVFSPVGGSNTLYIEKMATKQEIVNKLRFYTVSDAEARTYKLQIKFQYQDEDLNEYEEIEQIAVNVQQITKLEAGEVYFPETGTIGEPIDIYTSIINSGKVTVYNIWVSVEGEGFNTDESKIRIGTIGKGNSTSYEGRIYPTLSGVQEGRFVITGEDDAGDPVEHSVDFSVNVMEGMGGDFSGDPGMIVDPGMQDPSMMPTEEPQGFFAKALDFAKRPYVWGTAIGVVVVIVIVVIGIVRRKNKRIDFDE